MGCFLAFRRDGCVWFFLLSDNCYNYLLININALHLFKVLVLHFSEKNHYFTDSLLFLWLTLRHSYGAQADLLCKRSRFKTLF